MKLIIAGSRNLEVSESWIDHLLNTLDPSTADAPDEIISGGVQGIDTSGELFAYYLNIPIRKFLADWDKYGKAAGPIRNRQMAEYADCLLLIWDGKSRGSANMKLEMKKLKKPIYEVIICKHQD